MTFWLKEENPLVKTMQKGNSRLVFLLYICGKQPIKRTYYMTMLINALQKSALFKNIPIDQLDKILQPYQSMLSFQKNEIVALQGDRCSSLMMIAEGSVRCDMTDPTGKMVTIAILKTPDILAPAFIYATQNFFPINITALEPLTVLTINKNNFSRLLQENEKMLTNYLRMISDHTKFLTDKIRFLKFGTIKSKLALFFLEKMNSYGSATFVLSESQQALADLLGVTRPALARTMSEMMDEKLIVVQKKRITVLDPPSLKKLCY
jgi:CRP-like cAMP-binding protein